MQMASSRTAADDLLRPFDALRAVRTVYAHPGLTRRLTDERVADPFRLPPQPTPLLDRVEERKTATDLLADPSVRLLTLIGPGGVGKTHLATALVEASVPGLAATVRFVDLSIAREVIAAQSLIESALDTVAAFGRIVPISNEHTGIEHRTLLLLDNCEHLLPDLAHLVADLLACDDQVVIVATSREPLHLRWEHRLRIQPLRLPDPLNDASPEALLAAPAVALFVARARAVQSDFTLTRENGSAVAALCRQLDGLPLAIELAAARIDLLGPDAMLERLMRHLPLPSVGAEDAPARHHTLESAIDWSYTQLQPAEQTLFRRLAVLPGAWTLDAAEAVGDTRSLAIDGLTALLVLVDKGLLQVVPHASGEAHFTMLETVRSVGLHQLELAGELAEAEQRLTTWHGQAEAMPSRSAQIPCAADAAPTASPAPRDESPLSQRERDVLKLVAEGLPSKQIGRELGLAERTVKAHVTGAMNKLGAFSRAQALAIAVGRNYL
jgi:predicted ATPase/DNA-binding CsgD family transcriptional regulator